MKFPGGELVPIGGGDNVPLLKPHLTVGRSESCDICLRVSNVSSRHGELLAEDEVWYIRDTDSTNGIKVNGIRIPVGAKKMLRPGDKVSIGQRQFTIEYQAPAVMPLDEFRDLNPDNVFKESLLERAGLMKSDQDDADPVLRPKARSRPAPTPSPEKPETPAADAGASPENGS